MMKVLLFTLGLALAVLLMGFGVSYYVPKVEQDITARSIAALTAEGLAPQEAGYNFDISGRDVSLHGAVVDEETKLRIGEITASVEGVRSVDNQITLVEPPSNVLEEVAEAAVKSVAEVAEAVEAVAEPTEESAEVVVEPEAEVAPEAEAEAESLSEEVVAAEVPAGEAPVEAESRNEISDALEAPMDAAAVVTPADETLAAPVVTESESDTAKAMPVVDRCQDDLAKIVVAEPLHFEEGGAGLKPSSDAVLGKIVTAAQACKDSVIHIFGHTDNAGDTAANKVLSTERAKAVGVALMKKGIAHKVRATGLGGKFPIADNETEAGRAQNNRIEFKVYKIEESKS